LFFRRHALRRAARFALQVTAKSRRPANNVAAYDSARQMSFS
jgi:hypothetical protein